MRMEKFMDTERPKTWKYGRAPSMISVPLVNFGNQAASCWTCLLKFP